MFIKTEKSALMVDVHNRCTMENYHIREQALSIPPKMYLNFKQQSGIFLGRTSYDPWDSYIGVEAGEDILAVVLGGPGSYKTSAVAIPTLATFRGSIIALDVKPKGKMLPLWQSFNKRNGKPLLIFNPMNPDSWGYNPLLLLKADSISKVRHAYELALSILETIADDRDKIWRKTAQRYLSAMILYLSDAGAEFSTIMVALQNEPVSEMLKLIKASDNILAKMQATQISATDAKVINNIGMDIASLCVFATDPHIMSVLSADKENIIDWRAFNVSTRPFDICIQIPEEMIEQWSPLVALMFNQLTRILELREDKNESELPPLLVMIDEFGKISRYSPISAIMSGMETLRSRGVSYLLFVQHLSQLNAYGSDGISAFMGCVTHTIILHVGDANERIYIANLLGGVDAYDWNKSVSYTPQELVNRYSQSLSMGRKSLIFPEELGRLEDVILIHRKGVSRIQKVPYFNKEFLRFFEEAQVINLVPLPPLSSIDSIAVWGY